MINLLLKKEKFDNNWMEHMESFLLFMLKFINMLTNKSHHQFLTEPIWHEHNGGLACVSDDSRRCPLVEPLYAALSDSLTEAGW